MSLLKSNPTLFECQRYVQELEKERGYIEETILEKCLLLGEEVGELFRDIKENRNTNTNVNVGIESIQDELSDVFTFLCAIANRYNVDLEEAFRKKQEKNSYKSK